MSTKYHDLDFSQVSILVVTSYLLAVALTIFTLSNPMLSFMPPFALLLALFWSVQLINSSHLVTAMLLGLTYDVLYITLLGSHALIFILILFLMLRTRLRFRTYPLWQQGLFISFYFYLYQIIHYLFYNPSFLEFNVYFYWLMPIVAGIIWPGLVVTMRSLANKFSTL